MLITRQKAKEAYVLNGAVLVMFHCQEDTGYAIKTLEEVFFESLQKIVGVENIHFSYTEVVPEARKDKCYQGCSVIQFEPKTRDPRAILSLSNYIRQNRIFLILGFDQPPGASYYMAARASGVKRIVSYWGASMSSINSGIKLYLKRIEMLFRIFSPDVYIFESKAMQATAVLGRGIKPQKTRVIRLGVDTEKYKPAETEESILYVYSELNIPTGRKIVFYSGHMEPRKGVDVIINSAIQLVDHQGFENVHFLFLGNQKGEEERFIKQLQGTKARYHVTFAGYRDDIHLLLKGCSIGVIASTGWDSFTMSSLEMASAGLPIIASRLQGLQEAVSDGKTGYLFSPGDHVELAGYISLLLSDLELYESLSKNARERVVLSYSIEKQKENMKELLQRLV